MASEYTSEPQGSGSFETLESYVSVIEGGLIETSETHNVQVQETEPHTLSLELAASTTSEVRHTIQTQEILAAQSMSLDLNTNMTSEVQQFALAQEGPTAHSKLLESVTHTDSELGHATHISSPSTSHSLSLRTTKRKRSRAPTIEAQENVLSHSVSLEPALYTASAIHHSIQAQGTSASHKVSLEPAVRVSTDTHHSIPAQENSASHFALLDPAAHDCEHNLSVQTEEIIASYGAPPDSATHAASKVHPVQAQKTSESRGESLGSASHKGQRFVRRVRNFGRHASPIAAALDPDLGDLVNDDSSFSATSSDDSDKDSDSDSDKSGRKNRRQHQNHKSNAIKSRGSKHEEFNEGVKASSPFKNKPESTTVDSNAEVEISASNVPPTIDASPKVPKKLKKNVRVKNRDGTIATVSRATSMESMPSSKKSEEISTPLSAEAQAQNMKFHGIPYENTASPKKGITVIEKEISNQSQSDQDLPSISRRFTSLRIGQGLTWTVMVALSFLFIVLGILIVIIDGHPADSEIGTAVQQAIKVAVSVWPIAFAAVVAQSLRALASFKAERGLRLITLEQLMSSHSLASAIKQPFFLQRIDIMSITLLTLWALSPLAGQALLRVSYLDINGMSTGSYVWYLNTSITPLEIGASAFIPTTDALFMSSLLSPDAIQNSNADLWGNVKIPILPASNNYTEWKDISTLPSNTDTNPYSSLVGIPVAGIVAGYNTLFNITSSYFNLTCLQPQSSTNLMTINGSQIPLQSSVSGTLFMGASINTDQKSGRLAFVSTYSNTSFATTTCTFSPVIVDSQVSCKDKNCSVTAIRHSQTPLSGFANLPTSPQANLSTFISSFVNAGTSSSLGMLTPIEGFITGGGSFVGSNDGSGMMKPDLSQLNASSLQNQLGLLFNTYWQLTILPVSYTTSAILDQNPGVGPVTPVNVSATTIANELVYRSSWPWFAVFIFSSTILLVASIAGAVWASRTVVGGDVLGSASGWSLNSKYVEISKELKKGVRGMAGKMRAMGDVKVMLQDVRAGKEVGEVVLGTMGEGRERVREGRKYR